MSKETSILYDYPTEPVPQDKRRTWLNLSFVTAGLSVAMSTLYTGATLATVLNYDDAVFAIIGGCIFLFFMAGIMGGIGADKGVTFSVLSRHAFGRFGSRIVGLIWAISLTGWFAYQSGFFGQTINIMFPDAAITQVTPATIWGGLLMMTTAIIGFKGLAILSSVASPIILLVCVLGAVLAFNNVGLEAIAAMQPEDPSTLATGVTIVIGGWIVGAIMQPDVSRYVKSSSQNWVACGLAMVVFGVATFSGMVMVKAASADNIMQAMVGLGMGVASLLMVILAQWTSNDNNLYSASLGVANIKAIPKWRIALVLGIIATAIAAIGITGFFVPFLVFLGVFIPPIGGVIAIDYYVLGKKDQYRFQPDTQYRQWNIAAIVAVVLGGFAASQLSFGVGAINAFILGGLFYGIIMKLTEAVNMSTYIGRKTLHGEPDKT